MTVSRHLVFILTWCILVFVSGVSADDFDKNATLRETPTDIIGINHISLSVRNLDRALAFYQGATGFRLIARETVKVDKTADQLFARDNVEYEKATLRAPNWLLEISAFKHNEMVAHEDMPVNGRGMSHTCYQSPASVPGYEKFIEQGARVINRMGKPVYSSRYGVSYIYAYDPDGNLMELEQLQGEVLDKAGYLGAWQQQGQNIWMSQVSLFTHDRDRLMAFYQKIFAIKPNRVAEIANKAFGDNLFDLDDAHVKIGWFLLNHKSKVLEILQFLNPATPTSGKHRYPGDLGYSFSLEVADIRKEYVRLKNLGVEFF